MQTSGYRLAHTNWGTPCRHPFQGLIIVQAHDRRALRVNAKIRVRSLPIHYEIGLNHKDHTAWPQESGFAVWYFFR